MATSKPLGGGGGAATATAVDAPSNPVGSRTLIGPFDVKSPPIKKHMVVGHLVPTFRTATRFLQVRRRRLTIEIMRPLPNDATTTTPPPPTTTTTPESAALPWDPENEVLGDHDHVVFRILRLARKTRQGENETTSGHLGDDSDDVSVSTMGSTDDDGNVSGDKVWCVHKSYRFEEVEITKLTTAKKVMEVKLGTGHETVVRDFRFECESQAIRFKTAIERLKMLEHDRSARQVAKYKQKPSKQKADSAGGTAVLEGGDSLLQSPRSVTDTIAEDEDEDGENISLLVEIVSATNLPVADISSTDAYIVVRMKGKEIHRTDVISKNLSPIWTLSTGSLFLIQMTPEDFFASTSGVTFTLKDFDSVGANDVLGTVNVTLHDLLSGTGQRSGFEIVLAAGDSPDASTSDDKKKRENAMLYLRFKKATRGDIEFMEAFNARSKKFGMYADETFLPVGIPKGKLLQRQEKKGAKKEVLHRVRPGPDPDRPEDDTKWMTTEQIHAEALKPSTHWVQASSGDIGKLYLEVIGCDGLPNMDSSTLKLRDKTDAFACIVYQDCIVNTDVISNCLSPKWMPWCHRAFVFNISHPGADVLLGIFDYDPELSPLQLVSRVTSTVHDPIGRLVINVERFNPGTTYLLHYPLYMGELKEHRTSTRGTITLRLRLELSDMRKAMMLGMFPPPPATVSVSRRIDFELAHYTTDGIVDDQKYSLSTMARYIEELESYLEITEYLKEAAMAVLFWRGHFPVEVAGKSFNLPLHSMMAFTWGVLVTWNWNNLPAFLAFGVGWIFLATNEHMRQHPSRWQKCPSYDELFQRLLRNAASSETIAADTNLDGIIAYDKSVEEHRKRREMEKQKEAENEATLQEELGQEIEAAASAEQLGADDGGIFKSFDPLRPILFPIQQQLRQVVTALRITTSVVLWNESYYSFWITTTCFLLSAVAIWIPWAFLLRWIFRIVVFVGLGPWLALVDRFYWKTNPNLSNEDRDKELRDRIKSRYNVVLLAATNYFQRKERALKLLDMKKFMFGQHTLHVPRFCEDLYIDLPLPSSSCSPFDPDFAEPIHVEQIKFGQTLIGDMIPKREIQSIVADAKHKNSGNKKSKPFWKKKGFLPESVPLLGNGSERNASLE